MDFLNKLYSNDNFGIILFAFISILVLAFLIVLFFGKKDQKERSLAETNNENNNNEPIGNGEIAFTDNTQGTMLEANSPAVGNNIVMNNQILNTTPPVENTVMSQEPIVENETEIQPPKTDFDFDALAASISKELESIGVDSEEKKNDNSVSVDLNKTMVNIPSVSKIEENTPTMEEQKAEPEMNPNPVVFEPPVQEEPIEITVSKEVEKQMNESKTVMPSPTQFSSVFVNKKAEDNIGSVIAEEKKVTPVSNPVPQPMEMPKTIDLPKLNTEPTPKVEPVIEENQTNNVFPGVENSNSVYLNNDENRM